MSLLGVKQTLETIFSNEWTYTDIAWANVDFDVADKAEWTRFSVLPGDSNQASFGAPTNFYRSLGVLVVQIFVEPNSGAKRALELADYAIDIWRSRKENTVTCYSPSTTIVGVADGWYQVNVFCEYYADDIV